MNFCNYHICINKMLGGVWSHNLMRLCDMFIELLQLWRVHFPCHQKDLLWR
jgi:hypothetical protein